MDEGCANNNAVIDRLDRICADMVDNYNRMLGAFRPCKPGGEFLEQNLITLFSHEFLKSFPDGLAFTEVPFQKGDNTGSDYWSARLDGYFATASFGVFLEAKGSSNGEQFFEAIEADLVRIQSEGLKKSFEEMAARGRGVLPASLYGIVIADCWQKSQAEKWSKKVFNKEFKSIQKAKTTVYRGIDFDGKWQHYILACFVILPART